MALRRSVEKKAKKNSQAKRKKKKEQIKERTKKLKLLRGEVVSDKMDKTRVILLSTKKSHPFLKRSILRSRRVKIHDARNESKMGDLVSALETRPLSREKRHRLFRILEKAK